MKTKTFTFLMFVGFTLIASVSGAQEYEHRNRYARDNEERLGLGVARGYKEFVEPVQSDAAVSEKDPHQKVIGWNSQVPSKRFINAIKEGETDQLAILKLFSSPNIMGRDPRTNKETWTYHYLWSYKDEQDPNNTIIMMNRPGQRLKKNRAPVSMVITFDDKDVVDSYTVKLLKVKRDAFYDE
ncbi:MAG: hypothetical protein JNK65_05405 [Deltaproteobacteria bacterium]|nr:hypothetical protein [Deltaproteobacteria bacterium]